MTLRVGSFFLPALFLCGGGYLKEKDLKIKEKKDTLKALDRNRRALGHRNNRINTGMKAAFIRNAAESRNRKQEDRGNNAANEAVETYEATAASIGSLGADRLKKAFRLEKSRERQEQGRQQEKENFSVNAEPPHPDNAGIGLDDTGGIFSGAAPPGHEAIQGQNKQAEMENLQGKERNKPEMQIRQTARKGMMQGRIAHRQGAEGYLRTEPAYPQRNPVYPQDNLLKRDFLKKHRRKWESRRTQQYGQFQQFPNPKRCNSAPALPLSAGYGTDAGSTARGAGISKHKTVKRRGNAGDFNRIAESDGVRREGILSENKNVPIVRKLKNKFLSDKPIYQTAGKKSRLKTRLRQSVERAAIGLAKDILAALGSLSGAVAIMVIIAVVAALLSTSFGIFFSPFDQTEGTKAVSEIVAEVNGEFYAKAAEIGNSVVHDTIEYHNQPGGGTSLFITNWPDVIAVFSAKVSGEPDHALDAVTMDNEREKLLKKVFWDMNAISYDTEETGEGIVLHIRHTSKSYEEMMEFYHFTPYQRQAAAEMMKPEYAQMLSELIGTLGVSGGGSVTLTPEQAKKMLENLPENLTPERKAVMRAAYSLVGKVNYFWGGKSVALGWDGRWGTPTKVTAAGSSMTGTTRPFGLDCSGFVTWAFINATGNPDYANVIGHGAANQYGRCIKINWNEAQPGDLVFYPDLGHVGIIAGTDADGNLLVVHCASSQNNVVVTGLQGFTRIGRPVLFG